MKVGDTLTGTVIGIKPYGIFVELPNNLVGLVHISELKSGYVDNIYQQVAIGQEVIVQIIDIDEYSKKVSFSMRSLASKGQPLANFHRFSRHRYRTGFAPLRDQLPKWIAEGIKRLSEQQKGQES
ncbi:MULTISPECIES: CvfD/Ygs/GSP13 family RNA-binding post-transcriptional regulator [unclassified Streptococcus]|uniref:CvfD/Ygs/GSP13 family RNA-binding post-transcriptional regulator n=1 Tax=unclassified Streptococcus TaxID=2608887 RepID=UPI00359E4D28